MPKAKYEGIYHSLKKRIEAQDYPYQSLLPSENTLLEEYACKLYRRDAVFCLRRKDRAEGAFILMEDRGWRILAEVR